MKIVVITILSLAINLAHAQNPNHHPTHGNKSEKLTESKRKFKSPDDLRIRMDKISSLLKEMKDKKSNAKSIAEYGNKITNTVNDIFKVCKLEPDADAAIHPVLGLILEGSQEFKKGKYESGHAKIHQAFLDYEKLFTHEGWKY